MSNKKNSRCNNNSGKNNSNKKRPGATSPVIEGSIEKKTRRSGGKSEKTASGSREPVVVQSVVDEASKPNDAGTSVAKSSRKDDRKNPIVEVVNKNDASKTTPRKPKPFKLEPNPNTAVGQAPLSAGPKTPIPAKRFICVVCGTPHVKVERRRHMDGTYHQQNVAFFEEINGSGKELTGEVLRDGNNWKCNFCGSLPPLDKPQAHLVDKTHVNAVQKAYEGFAERVKNIAGLRTNEVPKVLAHTFYEEESARSSNE